MWVYSEFWACYRPFQSSSSYAVHLLRPPVSLCLTLPSLPSQLEEKARLEAEARARGHLHLREEQRRRAEGGGPEGGKGGEGAGSVWEGERLPAAAPARATA